MVVADIKSLPKPDSGWLNNVVCCKLLLINIFCFENNTLIKLILPLNSLKKCNYFFLVKQGF